MPEKVLESKGKNKIRATIWGVDVEVEDWKNPESWVDHGLTVDEAKAVIRHGRYPAGWGGRQAGQDA